MGYNKKQLHEAAQKSKGGVKSPKGMTFTQRSQALIDAFEKAAPTLWEHLTDDWISFEELKVYRKPDDTLLGVARIRAGDKYFIRFGSGDFIAECLVALDAALADRGWNEDRKKNSEKKK